MLHNLSLSYKIWNLPLSRPQFSESPLLNGSPEASNGHSLFDGDIDFDVDTSGQEFHVDVRLSSDTTSFSSGRRRSNLGDLELSGLAEVEEKDDDYAKKRKSTPTTGRRCVKRPTPSDNAKPIWMARYKALCQYQCKKGNCNVPQKYPEDKKLGKWVDNVSAISKTSDVEFSLSPLIVITVHCCSNAHRWEC